ncbi:hypothetical protein HOLleu_36064 [Holothuria leucospilota]|uniref:Uncharacterized protein n=1 Tax=Holothuria leucospilota TaxID=206669 RepID=A0A9Q1BEE7_HOLLE|nr:hypothetical protein HOLleu_36064 [Holothuria leucospilota]
MIRKWIENLFQPVHNIEGLYSSHGRFLLEIKHTTNCNRVTAAAASNTASRLQVNLAFISKGSVTSLAWITDHCDIIVRRRPE